MKKAYIFDLDGTLIDSMPMLDKLDKRIFDSFGIEMTEEAANTLRYLPYRESAEYIVDNFLPGRDYDEIERMLLDTVTEEYKKVPLKPGVTDFLEKARAEGIRMCVATATDLSVAEEVAERCGIAGYMEFTVTCDEVGATKYSPDVFIEAARRLGIEPSEAAVFEDGLPGAASSKAAGFTVVGVYEGTIPKKEAEELKSLSDRYITGFDSIGDVMP